jgi:predicted RNA-binding protein YlqC (UPF0109 family)
MQEVLIAIAKGLVSQPEAVQVTAQDLGLGEVVFHLYVAEEDKGRIIGQKGSKARAIRTIMGAVAAKQGKRSRVEID